MTARRGPTDAQKERTEEKIRTMKEKILKLETLLSNRDHPVVEPYLTQLGNRKEIIDLELDDHEKLNEVQVRSLLSERRAISRLISFDLVERALDIYKANLEKYKVELERGNTGI